MDIFVVLWLLRVLALYAGWPVFAAVAFIMFVLFEVDKETG
jgi:hypothetical protein